MVSITNGLNFEEKTNLVKHNMPVQFRENGPIFINVSKNGLKKYMISKRSNVKDAHGCKRPDECFINEDSRTIFIIEKSSKHV